MMIIPRRATVGLVCLFGLIVVSAATKKRDTNSDMDEVVAAPVCPCANVGLCQPISNHPTKQIVAFVVDPKDHYYHYDWELITTVMVTQDAYSSALMCHAHSHGVRLVYLANFNNDNHQLTNSSARTEWVNNWLSTVQNTFADGINLDFESVIEEGSEDRAGLTSLVQELSQTFHSALPNSQITVDVAWSPDCIDGRCYDYLALATSANFLLIMGYDEQSQIFPPRACQGYSNDPLPNMKSAVDQWLNLVGRPEKLVWGVPWYGYNYPCLDGTDPNSVECPIEPVPFRNASCSDAAGAEWDYQYIRSQLLPNSTTGRMWDDDSHSPWFNYVDPDTHVVHQVWYSDPDSLSERYRYAREMNLLGVAMWEADSLDYSGTEPGRTETREMWAAMHKFIDG